MQEMIDCLTEEVARNRNMAELTMVPEFKADYRHKADIFEKIIKILKGLGCP